MAYTRLVEGRALLRLHRRKAAIVAYRQAANLMTGRRVTRKETAVWRELADAFTDLGLDRDAAAASRSAAGGGLGESLRGSGDTDLRDDPPSAAAV